MNKPIESEMKQIKLFGQIYTIEENVDAISRGNLGEKSSVYAKINIDPRLIGHERIATLLHEIAHQIMRVTGAEHNIKAQVQEYICDIFSYQFATILLENPDFMDILKESES